MRSARFARDRGRRDRCSSPGRDGARSAPGVPRADRDAARSLRRRVAHPGALPACACRWFCSFPRVRATVVEPRLRELRRLGCRAANHHRAGRPRRQAHRVRRAAGHHHRRARTRPDARWRAFDDARSSLAALGWRSSPARGSFAVAGAYLMHGIDHILLGYDHLLFVLALILIVPNLRVLVATVTALHAWRTRSRLRSRRSASCTYRSAGRSHHRAEHSSARLRDRALWRGPTEPHGDDGPGWWRSPSACCTASVSPARSPRSACRAATSRSRLFTFNVGVEIGQLVFIAAVLASLALARRIPIPDRRVATGSARRDLRDRHACRVLVRRSRRGISA